MQEWIGKIGRNIIVANLKFNTNNIRRVPINRNSLFYDAQTFAFEREVGKNYIEQDMGQTVVLYQVDASQTQTDAVYGESDTDSVAFKTPVEIPCTYKIEEPELKSYDKSKQLGTYMKTGKLTIGVYQETLVELNAEIKKGDYIGVQISPEHMEFFVVNNDGKNNYDNAHSLWGTVPLYRTVQCSPVDSSEFKT
jgi:hypothetical protein